MREAMKKIVLGALLSTALATPAFAVTGTQTTPNIGAALASSVTFVGTAPVLTGTGTPTCASTGNGCTNQSGDVTAGATATSVVITFNGGGFGTGVPSCNVTPHVQLVAFSYVVSATAITVTQTATSGDVITWFCVPH